MGDARKTRVRGQNGSQKAADMASHGEGLSEAEARDCRRIQAKLRQLAAAHPELQPLVKAVPANCAISRRFLRLYFDSDSHYARKSLVLRTLLEDPSLSPEHQPDIVTLPLYRRVAQYFEHHPKQPLRRLTSGFKKEDIPAYLYRLFGIPRGAVRTLFSQFGVIPYLLSRRGELPTHYHQIRFPPSTDLEFLRSFYTSRLVTPAICSEFLEGRTTPFEYNTYFDTGDAALNLRNMSL